MTAPGSVTESPALAARFAALAAEWKSAVAITSSSSAMVAHPAIESLVGYLRHKHLLLLLDNCEHLIEACASISARLLSACPHLTILATSRLAQLCDDSGVPFVVHTSSRMERPRTPWRSRLTY